MDEFLCIYVCMYVDMFEAMLGTTKNIENIDGTSVDLTIRPGTRHGQKYSCRGLGFRNIRFNNLKGDLIIAVNVKTPSIKDPKLIDMVKDLANKVRSSEQ
jgi:DnaJ-class molecular chaperone